MSLDEVMARAVLWDHEHGWHPEQPADSDECPHPLCSEAYWLVTALDEARAVVPDFLNDPTAALVAEVRQLRTMGDVLDSAPRGLPRPRHASGLPTPWIANPDDLSDADGFRRAACVVLRLCQVCGNPLGATAVVCWREGDSIVTDGAALHPQPCWPMALRHCPELARLAAASTLLHAEVPTADLQEVETSASSREAGMPLGYAVPGSALALVARSISEGEPDGDD